MGFINLLFKSWVNPHWTFQNWFRIRESKIELRLKIWLLISDSSASSSAAATAAVLCTSMMDKSTKHPTNSNKSQTFLRKPVVGLNSVSSLTKTSWRGITGSSSGADVIYVFFCYRLSNKAFKLMFSPDIGEIIHIFMWRRRWSSSSDSWSADFVSRRPCSWNYN